jgi:hypothetical protein
VLIISALRRLRQEDHEFEASLDYISRPYFKKQNKTKQHPEIYISGSDIFMKKYKADKEWHTSGPRMP